MAEPLDEIRALTGHNRPAARGRAPLLPASGLLPLLGLLALICLLWSTPLVYPLRLLVVFFHELSHALMALLTGGSVLRIELSAMEGGLAVTAGGSRFLILSAGYLGSLLWGGVILWLAVRLRHPHWLSLALGSLLLLVSLLWVRPLLSFGMLFSLLAGGALLWIGRRAGPAPNALLLRLIGLTSLLYAPLDIVDDTLLRHGHPSDARMLAELTLVPTVVWGLLWCGLSIVLACWFVFQSARRPGH